MSLESSHIVSFVLGVVRYDVPAHVGTHPVRPQTLGS